MLLIKKHDHLEKKRNSMCISFSYLVMKETRI